MFIQNIHGFVIVESTTLRIELLLNCYLLIGNSQYRTVINTSASHLINFQTSADQFKQSMHYYIPISHSHTWIQFLQVPPMTNIKLLNCVIQHGFICGFLFSTWLVHTLFIFSCFNAQPHTYSHTLVYLCLLLVKPWLWLFEDCRLF